LRVLVHRHTRLYVGRNSRRAGPDLMAHFQGRGLDPKGHAYVCTVVVDPRRLDDEVAALVAAVESHR
jgi:hypothetical protein